MVRAYYTDQWSMCLLLNSNDEIKHEARRDTWPYRGIRHSSRVWMGSCIIRGRLWFVLPHGVTGWAMPGNCGGTDGLTQKKKKLSRWCLLCCVMRSVRYWYVRHMSSIEAPDHIVSTRDRIYISRKRQISPAAREWQVLIKAPLEADVFNHPVMESTKCCIQ